MTTIVIDTAAGREEGREALAAAAIASLELDVQLVVVGDEGVITPALQRLAHDAERVRVVHADTPARTIAAGLEITAREADAIFVSAGEPGLIIRESLRSLGRLGSVRRIALAAVYPTVRSHGPKRDPFGLLLDVGATIECTDDHLVAFAAMGAAYSAKISGIERPRVALLANGPSAARAPRRIQAAHDRLAAAALPFDFIGTVRGDQVTLGEADVVVTDGFSGDIVVRTLEGVALTAESLVQKAQERLQWRIAMGMLSEALSRLREFTDWENYGGAPLLGVTRPVIVTQTNSGSRAFVNAIRLGAKMERLGVVDAVEASAAVAAQVPPAEGASA